MIYEIKINDYRFFKNNTLLSFGADARTKRLLSNAAFVDGRYINKSIAIYGGNNSGKSNLISLFRMIKLVLSGKEGFVFNKMFFNDKQYTSISVTYNNLDNNGWLKYSFVFDNVNRKFKHEKLSSITYYPNGAPFEKTIFEKDSENKVFVVFGVDYSKFLDVIRIYPFSLQNFSNLLKIIFFLVS